MNPTASPKKRNNFDFGELEWRRSKEKKCKPIRNAALAFIPVS